MTDTERTINLKKLWFLPLPFILDGLINMTLYPLGLGGADSKIRKIIFILVNVCYFLWVLFYMYKEEFFVKEKLKNYTPIFIWLLIYAYAFALWGINTKIIQYLQRFIIFSIPAFLIGHYINKRSLEKNFFYWMEKLSIITIPAMICYFKISLDMKDVYWTRNLGAMSYMSLSYAWMPMMFAILLNIYRDGFVSIEYNILNKKINVHPAFRIIMAFFLWYMIQIATTRGAILGSLIFYIILIILLIKDKKWAKKPKILFAIYLVMCVFVFGNIKIPSIELPKINYGIPKVSEGRFDVITESIEEGKIKTSETGILTTEDINELVSDPKPINNHKWVEKELVSKDGKKLDIRDRVSLYKLAFAEAKNRPFRGLGAFGFNMKYGIYPHNFALEMFDDLGFLLATPIILCIMLLFIRVIKQIKTKKITGELLIFIIGNAFMILVSGSAYDLASLFFCIGYGMATFYNSDDKKYLPYA